MKKIFNLLSIAAVATMSLASCDMIFDSLEGDLSKMTQDDMMTPSGLDRRLAALYNSIPMNAFGDADFFGEDATSNQNGKYGVGGVMGFWDYTTMRDVNLFFRDIETAYNNKTITESEYKSYLGEAYFIRGYYYYASVRLSGGVPIVTEPLDDKYDGKENAGLYVPRSTEKESWDFVLSEFDNAAKNLPEVRTTGRYRATKWSALGMKSRAALNAASVSKYWNQAPIADSYTAVSKKLAYMEASYATNYYKQCIEASEAIINSGMFALYGAKPNSVAEAVNNLTTLFQDRQDCEWIFGKTYKTGSSTATNGFDLKSSPNQVHGSSGSVWMFGQHGVTLDFVDACDNYDENFGAVDGTVVTRVDGNESTYTGYLSSYGTASIPAIPFKGYATPDEPFLNKDARFQAWVIYPDCTFRGEKIKIQGGMIKKDGTAVVYPGTTEGEELNGVMYYPYGAALASDFSGFWDRKNTNAGSWYSAGFGIRKYLDPASSVVYSTNPWYDLRYAEILLNYCEAEVELNGTNAGNSKDYLNQIRRRAYFLDEKDATIENILHERRIEFAFENDRPLTLFRRRAFFNQARDGMTNPTGGRKHALICMPDLRNGKAQYVFLRAYVWMDDPETTAGATSVDFKSYYGSISNYDRDRLVPNPSQE